MDKASLVSAQVGAVGWGTKADGGDGAQLRRVKTQAYKRGKCAGVV